VISPTVTTAILNIARGHNWVVEEGGSNTGQAVNAILARVGLQPGAPWCAAFIAYVGWLLFRETWPLPMTGGCTALADVAHTAGVLNPIPVPGSVFVLWSPALGRYHHCGFLWDRLPNGQWRTIEGNTNTNGSPDGTGVYVRQRGFAPLDRFIAWDTLPPKPPTAA
jgi:hypothetical protein